MLEILTDVPRGCFLHLVNDLGDAPVINPGDFVVVDPKNRAIEHSSLVLLRQSRGPVVRRIDRASGIWSSAQSGRRSRAQLFMAGQLVARDLKTLTGAVAVRNIRMVDGPMDRKLLRSKLIGRVLGLYRSPQ